MITITLQEIGLFMMAVGLVGIFICAFIYFWFDL